MKLYICTTISKGYGDVILKRKLSLILILCLLLSTVFCLPCSVTALADNTVSADEVAKSNSSQKITYASVYESGKSKLADSSIKLDITSAKSSKEITDSVTLDANGDWVEWTFSNPTETSFHIEIEYEPIADKGNDISFSLDVNGFAPFEEAASLTIPRIWQDEKDETKVKENADEVRPFQKESIHKTTAVLQDSIGIYNEAYFFAFGEGEQTIRITLNREAVKIYSVTLCGKETVKSYKDYIKAYGNAPVKNVETYRLEAENAFEKNSAMLYPTSDRGSAATLPNHPLYVRLNTIGASTWTKSGQTISWKVDVPEKGLYKIAFRARQSAKQGLSSYRTLTINGEIPFAECQDITFEYHNSWYNKILGDDEPMYLYLEPGDILSLSCTSGPTAEILRNIQNSVLDMNNLYRKIIVITGTDPDIYRDYSLKAQIPEMMDTIKNNRKVLNDSYNKLLEVSGQDAASAAVITKMVQTLDAMLEQPNTIAATLTDFQSDIQSLSSLITTLGEQPLELDCIAFMGADGKTPRIKANFFTNFSFNFKKFIGSFTTDYRKLDIDNAGNAEPLVVWLSTGRDQATVTNNIIKDLYTDKTGIPVQLTLIDVGDTLIKAVLAGQGPDAALGVAQTSPINLAMRGALVDLNTLGLDDETKNQFYPSAMKPFEYLGGIYALPELQAFEVLFYRTDVFEEYGLTVPNTWDEFYEIIRILQNNNLGIGVAESQQTFNWFLFQNGGEYYTENLDGSLFDTEVAYSAFEQWTKLYSKYGLDRAFDFFNRFRSGEMPIAISAYSSYNQLSSAAPELRGLWAMAPVPGTLQEDGTINRAETATISASIIIKTGKGEEKYKQAYDFIKWWTGSEAQSRFAQDIEASLGVAARYTPANLAALEAINWSTEELAVLKTQGEQIHNIPEIPGNYIIARCLSNAFRSTVDDGKNARRQLAIYDIDINEEITRKRKEFNLNVGE